MTRENIDLFTKVNLLATDQFTGKLEVNSTSEERWQLFFSLGRLIWGDGGLHPNRSWRRLLSKYCHNIDLTKISLSTKEQFESLKYQTLTLLLARKLIQAESAKAMAIESIDEIIFEIIEHQAIESISYANFPISDYGLSLSKNSPVFLDPAAAITASQEKWALWTQKDLSSYSPNLAPTIAEPKRLQESVNQVVYNNFVALLDGNNTLRDLALQMKSDPITIISSLVPYINRGYIDLIEVGDIEAPINPIATSPPKTIRNKGPALIACIDDSLQIGLIMEQIITKAGYKFISIQQPLQAIPTLIANPPDLIFLDVRMPIINGYELCSQIGRISQLQNIPIVMLTGQDGIVDRMRAKLVGACDFMSKPIDDQKVVKVIQKILLEYQIQTN